MSLAILVFYLVVVPLVLIYFQNARKERQEIIQQLRETNRLLTLLLQEDRARSDDSSSR